MSQSYALAPGRPLGSEQSSTKEASTTNFADLQREDKPLKDENIQGTYIDHKDR